MFGTTNSYMSLDAWILANIVQLATFDFCRRFLSPAADPCGRQFDQMTQAARSGQANIAEGCARGKTSKETEMKLLDVARASLAELNGDFTFWLMRAKNAPWPKASEEAKAVFNVILDRPDFGSDWCHDSCCHILQQKEKFEHWLDNKNDVIVANALLILISRTINAINHLMERKLGEFKENGGFTENLTKIRLEARDEKAAAEGAPKCPLCGKIMRKRLCRKGKNAGHAFWSCSDYPNCRGTRDC